MTRLFGTFLAAVCVALAVPLAAAAQEKPPPISSIQQYIETVPTGGGGAAVGHTQPDKPGSSPAKQRIQELLKAAGDDASILESIATSRAYGAPDLDARLRSKGRVFDANAIDRSDPANPKPRDVGADEALSSAVETFAGAGEARVAALIAALVLISASMLASARLRHR